MGIGRTADGAALSVHAKFFRGLADPARLGILRLLVARTRSAGELAQECGLSVSNASNHLRCLLECGLVTVEVEGRHNLYALRNQRIARVLEASMELLQSPEGSLIRDCSNYESVSRRALRSSSRALTPPSADGRRRHSKKGNRAIGGRSTGR